MQCLPQNGVRSRSLTPRGDASNDSCDLSILWRRDLNRRRCHPGSVVQLILVFHLFKMRLSLMPLR